MRSAAPLRLFLSLSLSRPCRFRAVTRVRARRRMFINIVLLDVPQGRTAFTRASSGRNLRLKKAENSTLEKSL